MENRLNSSYQINNKSAQFRIEIRILLFKRKCIYQRSHKWKDSQTFHMFPLQIFNRSYLER